MVFEIKKYIVKQLRDYENKEIHYFGKDSSGIPRILFVLNDVMYGGSTLYGKESLEGGKFVLSYFYPHLELALVDFKVLQMIEKGLAKLPSTWPSKPIRIYGKNHRLMV